MKILKDIAAQIRAAGIPCNLCLSDAHDVVDDQIDLADFPGAFVQISATRTGLEFMPGYFHDAGDDSCMVDGPVTRDPVAAAHKAVRLYNANAKVPA